MKKGPDLDVATANNAELQKYAKASSRTEIELKQIIGRYPHVDRVIARRKDATAELLSMLSSSEDKRTLKAVITHDHISPEDLLFLAPLFPTEFLENPNLDLILSKNPEKLQDLDAKILVKIANRTTCPEKYLQWAAMHSNKKVLLAIAKNRETPVDILNQLGESQDCDVVDAASTNKQSRKIKKRLKKALNNKAFIENIIEEISQKLLNFFSDPYHIASGISRYITNYEPGLAPFSLDSCFIPEEIQEVYRSIDEELKLISSQEYKRPFLYEDDDEYLGMDDEICCYITDFICLLIKANWAEIIQRRLVYEETIEEKEFKLFSKFRDLMICFEYMHIHIYTKDYDGVGPDLLCQCDCSDFYLNKPVNSYYSNKDDIIAQYKNDLPVFEKTSSFANVNAFLTDEPNKIKFLGNLHENKKVIGIVNKLSEKIGIKVNFEEGQYDDGQPHLKIEFPGLGWVRKVPEALCDSKNSIDFSCYD